MGFLKNWFGYHRKAKAKQRAVLEDLTAESPLIVRENRLRERGYVVMLANSFATPVEAKKEFVYCEYYTGKPPQYLHDLDRKVACFNAQVYTETSRKENKNTHPP